MTNIISFPKLGLEFTINESVGIFNIRWYGVLIAVGFLLAMLYAFYRAKDFGIISDKIVDVAIWGTIGGIVGARAYFVIFYENSFDSFWDIFKIWEGGLAIYGGLIGGLGLGILGCYLNKVKILPMVDLAVMGFLIGQGIGRWGNFANGEAYGVEMTNVMPWGMQITEMQNGLVVGQTGIVHPCFLYESLWCILGFVLLHFYSKHRRFDGEILLMYLGWYGFERFFVEGLRTDSLYWGNFRVSQVLAAICVVVSLVVWIVLRVKIKRNESPEYLMPFGNTEEAQMMIEEYNKNLKSKKDKKAQKTEEE